MTFAHELSINKTKPIRQFPVNIKVKMSLCQSTMPWRHVVDMEKKCHPFLTWSE